MKQSRSCSYSSSVRSFTLIELLTSIAILGVIASLLFAALNQGSKAWLQGESRVETFIQARAALDFISRDLSQAITTSKIPFVGNRTNLAFIAAVGDDSTHGMDLMEVVYRLTQEPPIAGATDPGRIFVDKEGQWPKQLVRRASHYSATMAEGWDYGLRQVCSVQPPWDFYSSPFDWPETSVINQTALLATNVLSLEFKYQDNANPTPGIHNTWNSTAASAWNNELQPPVPPGLAIMAGRAPTAVLITIRVIESRAAARLKDFGTLDAGFLNITNQSARAFSTYIWIPNRQP